jgi:drug/metabolite transporter (DMT)-like permease
MRRSVIVLQFLVAFIWGASWIAGRIVAVEVPPLMLAVLRVMIATIVLGVLVWRKDPAYFKLPLKYIGDVFLMGLLGICAYAICFFYSLQWILPGRAALVVALNPVVVTLGAWLFMKESLTIRQWCGVIIALLGAFIVLGHGDPLAFFREGLSKGEYLLLAGVLFWTIYTLLGRRIQHAVSPLTMTFYASLFGCIILAVIGIFEGAFKFFPHFSKQAGISILYLGILSSGFAYAWYAEGLKVLGSTVTAVFMNLVPVFAVLLSGLFLHETIALSSICGGVIVLMGVLLTTYAKKI